MDKNEVYYGILFTRKVLSDNVFAFVPNLLVEGNLSSIFVDASGNDIPPSEIDENITDVELGEAGISYIDCFHTGTSDFFFIEDMEQLETDIDTSVVGKLVTKDDLKELYPDALDLEEAKARFFDDSSLKIYLGFIDYTKYKIEVAEFNYQSILDALINKGFDDVCLGVVLLDKNAVKNGKINLNQPAEMEYKINVPEEFKDEDDLIFFTKKMFNSLIDSKDYNNIISTLKEIQKEIEDKKIETNFKSGKDIVDKYNDIYRSVCSIEDINDLHTIFDELSTYSLSLAMMIEENKSNKVDKKDATKEAYTMAEKYQDLSKLDDINKIKFEFTKLYKEHLSNFEKIGKEYDLCKKEKEETKKEIKELKKEVEKVETISEKDKLIALRKEVIGLSNYMNERIIGQTDAKQAVLSALFSNKLDPNPRHKNNVLLVGPTGSGKTLIAETVGEYLDTPVQIIDTTQLTAPGYKGADLEEFLAALYTRCNGDLQKAEHAIVVFDEIDKKGSDSNEDVSGKGVLNTLLPFIQGTKYNFELGHGISSKTIEFDTSNLTIFATGSFAEAVKRELNDDGNENTVYNETKIGFGISNIKSKENKDEDIKYKKLTRESLEKYGKIPPELIGRFTCIAQLNGHTKESLKEILLNKKISPLYANIDLFNKMGVSVSFKDDFIDEIVSESLKEKTGARSLKTKIEEALTPSKIAVLYTLGEYDKMILSKDTVKTKNAKLRYSKDENETTRRFNYTNKVLEELNLEVNDSKQKVKVK